MLTKEKMDFLKEARVGRIATIGYKNLHLVPICYAYDEKNFYIATDKESVKARNLRKNPEAVLLIDEYFEDWSKLKGIMIKGKVEIIEKGEEFKYGKDLLYKKYPQYEKEVPIKEGESVILKLEPKKIISWGWK